MKNIIAQLILDIQKIAPHSSLVHEKNNVMTILTCATYLNKESLMIKAQERAMKFVKKTAMVRWE